MALKYFLTSLAILSIGCSPEKEDTASDSTTSAASTSTADDTTATTNEPTETGEPTTETGEPTAGDTGALSCQPPPLVGEACAPAGETKGSFYFDQDVLDVFDAMCTVDSVDDDGETQSLTLTCDGKVERLDMISANPHLPVPVGAGSMVQLQVTNFPTLEEANPWFALRETNGRLLAAGLKNAVLPQPAPLQIEPLSLELVATDCEPIDDGFVVTQRAGLSVTVDGKTAVVFDGNTAEVGGPGSYRIVVGHATRELCVFDNAFNSEPWGVDALMVFAVDG